MNEKIKVLNVFRDERVDAISILTEMSIGTYVNLAKENIDELDIQRGKVITKRKEVYKRLIEDLKNGAVIPSLSLAVFGESKTNEFLKSTDIDLKKIEDVLNNKIEPRDIVILDGLQRTYCFLNIIDEYKNDEVKLNEFKNKKIRVEIWCGVTFNSLLYKMLVLNTGQIKMSIKHQLEIINLSLKEKIIEVARSIGKEIKLSTYKEPLPPSELFQYRFSTLIEAYTSFITKSEHVDKTNEIVAELERMKFIEEHKTKESLKDKEIEIFTRVLLKFDELLYKKYKTGLKYDDGKIIRMSTRKELINSAPFLCGFFAALGKAKEKGIGIEERLQKLEEILSSDDEDPLKLKTMSKIVEEEKGRSKRFGMELREFFRRAFYEFFVSKEDDFENIWRMATR